MSSGIRGALAGSLTLIALYTFVTTGPEANRRISGLFAWPAKMAQRLIDPTVPAIPDLREPSGTSTPGVRAPRAPHRPRRRRPAHPRSRSEPPIR